MGSIGLEFCILSVRNAAVLASGLVINATHRFILASSHIDIERDWTNDVRDATRTKSGNRSSCSQRSNSTVLYTFRQQFAGNPGHTLLQSLPMLALVLPRLQREDSVVLAPSPLFQLLASRILPPHRILLHYQPIEADTVRIVVGRPPFSPLLNVFPRGLMQMLRPSRPSVVPIVAPAERHQEEDQQPLLLFLSRSQSANHTAGRQSRPGVRSFDNEDEVIKSTRAVVASAGNGLSVAVVRTFSTLKRQAQVYARARVIVGPEGSAFSGVAFAPDGVSVIEWVGLRDDTYYHLLYLGMRARYFQLLPHWLSDGPRANALCAETNTIDNCPWSLTHDDFALYLALLRHVVRDGGKALCGAGAAEARDRSSSHHPTTPRIGTIDTRLDAVRAARIAQQRRPGA